MLSVSPTEVQKRILLSFLLDSVNDKSSEDDAYDDDSDEEDDELLDDLMLQCINLQLSLFHSLFSAYQNDELLYNIRTNSILLIQQSRLMINTIFNKWEDQRFYSNFRMNREYFSEFCSEIKRAQRPDHIYIQRNQWVEWKHNNIHTIETGIMIFLYWLASEGCVLRDLVNIFHLTTTTIHRIISKIRMMIKQRLLLKYVTLPQSKEDWKNINKRWSTRYVQGRKSSPLIFPNVVGAIDGTHVQIVTPDKKKYNADLYFNRKGFHSVVLQGMCDDRGIFINANVGQPGSSHDSRVFRLSSFWQGMHSDGEDGIRANFPEDHFILADAAYAIREWLLPAYKGIIDGKKLIYNYIHSAVRMVVERALGRLKGRWRRIKKMQVYKMEEINSTVQCAVILHNFVESRKDYNNIKNEDELEIWEKEEFEQRREIQRQFQQENNDENDENKQEMNDVVVMDNDDEEMQDSDRDDDESEDEQARVQRERHTRSERALVSKGSNAREKVVEIICARILNGARDNPAVLSRYYRILSQEHRERDALEADLRFLNAI
jgi:hypothetical protein